MKQAIHIFAKDVRRLWLQIVALMLAIAWFAAIDVRWSALNPTDSGALIIEFIVGSAVWFLIARAVHEESLPGENQFWLTRPYERGSLLGAKIMMAVWAVGVPLFVADCLILSVQSLPVAGNLGGLVLRQLVIAAWLILPPFAIASVTRSITKDVMAWLVALAFAAVASGRVFPANEKYAFLAALALMLAAVWRQYSRRGTRASRALIAVAVLLPTLPFPESAALAIEGLRNDPATAGISLAAKVASIVEPPQRGMNDSHCAPIAVSVEGVRPGWRLAVLSEKDTFSADGNSWSGGWRPALNRDWDFNNTGTAGNIRACVSSAGLKELGIGKPLTAHVSVALAVFANDAPIGITAGLAPFEVPGIGRCRFQYYAGSDKYVLSCKAPVWFPRPDIVMVTENSGKEVAEYLLPMNLPTGMSPVSKWITLPMDTQIRDAAARGGRIEFRTETRIAVLRREVTVKEARFLGLQ